VETVDLVVAVVDLELEEVVIHPQQVLHKELMAVVETLLDLLVVAVVVEQTQLEEQLDHVHQQEEKVEQELQIQSQDVP
tara:strand:- start:297 stop:533 length:237 start_codon:yes stop_codon:yes gene_type:complete